MDNNQKALRWSVMEPWNLSITTDYGREFKPRDFLYMGEIGGSHLTTYWKMKGIEPTNKINDIKRRKMEAGNFYEAIVVWVFQRCGILKNTQGKVRIEDPKYLTVYGRYDILAGHDGNWDKTKKELFEYFDNAEKTGYVFPFHDSVKRKSFETVKYLSEKFPNGLQDKIYEVKSIQSAAFWRHDQPISRPYEKHNYQLSNYIKHNFEKVDIGSFLYVDRDTMSLSEIPIYQVDERIIKKSYEWLEQMTYYYRNDIEPPKPEFIIWDEETGKWTFNVEVSWSEYKDKLLNGVSESQIIAEIKNRNKELSVVSKMKMAIDNKEFRGIKKYQKAIELLNSGMSYVEVEAKMKIPAVALLHYIEEVQNTSKSQ